MTETRARQEEISREEQRKRDEESLKEEREINDEISLNSMLLRGCFVMLVILIVLPDLKPYVIPSPDGESELTLNFAPKIVPIGCLIFLIVGIWTHKKELVVKSKQLAERNARITRNT